MPASSVRSRGAFATLCAGLLVCTLWLPLRGRVVYPTFDQLSFFLPELELHLNGDHARGPALWNPHVQLGRPAVHFGGLSQAYWLTHVLSWALDDAVAAHSALVLATFMLGGFFAWGLFRALALHPWAAATCALGFAFAPFHGQAGLFLCFLGGSVWTMGLAWALVRVLRARSPASGLLLAFVVHSSILGSYPQQLVWAAWLGLVLVIALLPPRGERVRSLAAVLGWSALGVLSAAPFLLDLVEQARASSRLSIDPFFHRVQSITGLRDGLVRLRELGDPLWNGRDFATFGQPLWGASFTPFFGAAMLLALWVVRTRLVVLCGGFVLATLFLGLSRPLYEFGVRYLGLWLSIFHPFAAATVPVFLLAAVGLDHCLRFPGRKLRALHALVLPALLAVGALAAARPLHGWNIALSLALAGCAALTLVSPVRVLLAAAALVSATHYGVAGLAAAESSAIGRRLGRHAEEAAEIRRRTAGGRFAWIGAGRPPLFPCNTEQLHGLASIHSYDVLSSQRYQDWTRRICARGPEFRGRFFQSIADAERLASEDFARAGVRLVLAREELRDPALRSAGKLFGYYLHDVVAPVPLQAWVPRSACELAPDGARIPAPLARVGRPAARLTHSSEHLVFTFAPSDEFGLLWVSQQHHPHWRARAGVQRLRTVAVDGLWQGVLVPPGVAEVELEFRPWLRGWWWPQLGFALAGVVLGVRSAARRFRAVSDCSAWR